MNYFPFHVGDYAAHTRHLSLLEDLAYRRLLDAYYLSERPLSGSAADVARLIGMREHAEAVDFVLRSFFVASEEGFRNKRADQEISAFVAKREQQARAGRASAERRFNDRLTTVQRPFNENATDVQPTNNQNQNQPSSRATGKPPKPPRGGLDVPAGFSEFWLAWPSNERKQDKAKCLEQWKRQGLEEFADKITADVRIKRGTQKWRDGFIEAPLVYLRGRRWEDGVQPQEGGIEEVLDWRSTGKSIIAKGIELGCGEWSEALWSAGKVPAFPGYRAMVEKKVAELEAGNEHL